MPPRRCCCEGCIFARDFFDRADAPTLGPDWTDPDSAFGTNGGFAYMPTGDHIAIFDIPHIKNDPSGVAYYKIINEVDDAIYYIIVNAVDANNYHIAKFHNISVPKIELGVVVAGSYTLLKQEDILGMTGPEGCTHGPSASCRIFTARIAPGEFCAAIDQSVFSQVTVETEVLTGGIYAGLGGSGDDLFFDNFEFSEHFATNVECPLCICECEEEYVTVKLDATFVDATNRISEVEGCTAELEWDRVNGWWETESFVCCVQSWIIELYCPPSGLPEDYELRIILGCISSDTNVTVPGYIDEGWRSALEGSTCSPLYLRFGPFQVTDLDFACGCPAPFEPTGVFYIEVTEA